MSRIRMSFAVVGAAAFLWSVPMLMLAAPETKKPATSIAVEKKQATPHAKPPEPRTHPDGDRNSGDVDDIVPDQPREPTSSRGRAADAADGAI